MGCIFAPAFSTATLGVKNTDAGIASAMVNTSQQVGGSVGTALLSTHLRQRRRQLRVHVHARTAGLAGAASIHGYTTAFEWAAGLFAAGLLSRCSSCPETAPPGPAPPTPRPARNSSSAWKPPERTPAPTGGVARDALDPLTDRSL